MPASKIYNDAGIVQISPATTAPVYTRQHFPGAFRVVASDAKLGSTLSKYATDTLKAKNIAIIDDRTTYGQGVADEFAKGLKKPGIKVVGHRVSVAEPSARRRPSFVVPTISVMESGDHVATDGTSFDSLRQLARHT